MYVSAGHTGFSSKASSQTAVPSVALLVVAAFLGIAPASALTEEQARQQCREAVGHPIVQNCLGPKRKGITDAEREACRAKARPAVSACMHKALNAAQGRANVPVAMPTEIKALVPESEMLPAAFVAPPRTIGDIAAILDAEKPDRMKIEILKTT